jgi:hypothetical protein
LRSSRSGPTQAWRRRGTSKPRGVASCARGCSRPRVWAQDRPSGFLRRSGTSTPPSFLTRAGARRCSHSKMGGVRQKSARVCESARRRAVESTIAPLTRWSPSGDMKKLRRRRRARGTTPRLDVGQDRGRAARELEPDDPLAHPVNAYTRVLVDTRSAPRWWRPRVADGLRRDSIFRHFPGRGGVGSERAFRTPVDLASARELMRGWAVRRVVEVDGQRPAMQPFFITAPLAGCGIDRASIPVEATSRPVGAREEMGRRPRSAGPRPRPARRIVGTLSAGPFPLFQFAQRRCFPSLR